MDQSCRRKDRLQHRRLQTVSLPRRGPLRSGVRRFSTNRHRRPQQHPLSMKGHAAVGRRQNFPISPNNTSSAAPTIYILIALIFFHDLYISTHIKLIS